MGSRVRDSLTALALAALVAAALPAAAGDAQPGVPGPKPAAPAEASCRVPQPGDPAPVAAVRPDLAAQWARLAAELPKARAEGIRPLNTRGYNYDTGHGGLDPAAIEFEARAH